MDEKETYLKDNEASRAELEQAIERFGSAVSDDIETTRYEVHALLDVLYARLYLAECPF